jgi:polyisoprenoid-binding protein YceI
MPTKSKALLWISLLGAAVAQGSPVIVDKGRSDVEIAVKATIGSFVAKLQDYEVSVTLAQETGSVTATVFRMNFATVRTGDTDRDRDMTDWEQAGRYPDVVFTLTSLEPGAGAKYTAHGRLLFHGVDRPISFPMSVEMRQRQVDMQGAATVDTREFGLPVITKYLLLKVDPIVRLQFHLQGRIAPK